MCYKNNDFLLKMNFIFVSKVDNRKSLFLFEKEEGILA
jgi:hypothetical protein